jgi:hypothetical protein
VQPPGACGYSWSYQGVKKQGFSGLLMVNSFKAKWKPAT